MAVITATEAVQDKSGKVESYRWDAVTENDTCKPVRVVGKRDFTLSLHGSPGGSSTTLYMSSAGLSDPSTLATTDYWVGKDTVSGSAVALTADNTAANIVESAVWFQPFPSGGTSQNLTIYLEAK